jgi:hypothetical protein
MKIVVVIMEDRVASVSILIIYGHTGRIPAQNQLARDTSAGNRNKDGLAGNWNKGIFAMGWMEHDLDDGTSGWTGHAQLTVSKCVCFSSWQLLITQNQGWKRQFHICTTVQRCKEKRC